MQTVTYSNITASDFCIGDIVAIRNFPVRIVGIKNSGTLMITFLDGSREGTFDTVIDAVTDIRITDEILRKNGFVYLNNHCLTGAQWRLSSETDDCHWIELRIGEFISGKYLDDRVYENLMTRRALTLRDLQHALNMDRMNKILQY